MRWKKIVTGLQLAVRSLWDRLSEVPPLGFLPGSSEEPPVGRTVGIEIVFAQHTGNRGIRANQVYSALLALGDVETFHPNFVIASDDELRRFWLVLRTESRWDAIETAVRGAVEQGALDAVNEVPAHKVLSGPAAAIPDAEDAPSPVAPLSSDVGTVGPGPDMGEPGMEQRTIRVDLNRLESLSNLVGELAVEKAQLIDVATRLEVLCVEGESRRLVQELRRSVSKLATVSGNLQELATELRMVPVGTLFRRFIRLVRELSAATGKPLTLVREGESTMLDKTIVEEMAAPLMHLIRNAADHGIETSADRRRAGKPESGRITLRAYDQGDQVVIEVEDDGRGLDLDRIRARAIERGLVPTEVASALTDDDVAQLVFHPGFSTAREVTDISGRGVGMDVVKASVERLRGTVELCTESGTGTRVVMRLPLTISIIPVMFVDVAGQTLAVPMAALAGMVRVTDTNRVLWGSVLRHQDRLVPLIKLSRIWWDCDTVGGSALIIRTGDEEIALLVDRALGLGDVVIKPLGDYVGRLPGVAGTAILADGRVALVLDPVTLLPGHMYQTEGEIPLGTAVAH